MPFLLPKTYQADSTRYRMRSEGDHLASRKYFFQRRSNNLRFLLRERFDWMNPYLDGKEKVFELGSGAGLAKEFIRNPNLKLTDVTHHPWIDLYVDALNLPFAHESVDALICSHMIHHLAHPIPFLKGARNALKKNGLLLVCDAYNSLLARLLMRIMHHEGWSYEVNVFDENQILNDPCDPWSANGAIPQMLFQDTEAFEKAVPGFKVVSKELTECLIFPLSGGVTAKTFSVPLPVWALKAINHLDKLLVRTLPNIFALGLRVVLQRMD